MARPEPGPGTGEAPARPQGPVEPSRDQQWTVLRAARASPERSSRQIAAWITDHQGYSVSESTVYRILKREGLVKRLDLPTPAGKQYTNETTAPRQLWTTDASFFRVIGWGYYYRGATASRLAHRL